MCCKSYLTDTLISTFYQQITPDLSLIKRQ